MRWMMAWLVGLLVLSGGTLSAQQKGSPSDLRNGMDPAMGMEMRGGGSPFGSGMGTDPFAAAPEGDRQLPGDKAKSGARSTAFREAAPVARVRWVGPAAEASQRVGEKMRQETKIQFIDTPLDEVVGYLKQLHGIEIQIDERALKEAGLKSDLPITRNIEGISLEAALDIFTEEERLGWYVERGMLIITSAEAAIARMSVRLYRLPDIHIELEELLEALFQTVQPDSWKQAGGDGNVVLLVGEQVLVVRQNHTGHALVESLLQQLAALSEGQ